MVRRSFWPDGLASVIRKYPEAINEDFDAVEWLSHPENVALTDEGGNYGMFAFQYPGVYVGHYFFDTARGKDAMSLAKEMLRDMYKNREARVVVGFTPLDKKAALAITRRLGFTSHGEVEFSSGPCELFTLTASEFLEGNQDG